LPRTGGRCCAARQVLAHDAIPFLAKLIPESVQFIQKLLAFDRFDIKIADTRNVRFMFILSHRDDVDRYITGAETAF